MSDMTMKEMESRIALLQEEIEGLSPWGSGVILRREEIWSLERRLHWKRTRSGSREEIEQEAFIQPVGNESPPARASHR